MGIFQFVEIKSAFLFIFSERIGIFQLNFEALIQVSKETFWHTCTFRIWNIWECPNYNYSLLYTIYFSNFVTWYEVKNNIGDTLSLMQLVNDFTNLVTWLFLKKGILVRKLCIDLLPKLLHTNFNFVACMEVVISVRSTTIESISGNSHVTTLVTPSIDPNYQGVCSVSLNWYHVRKYVNKGY